MIRADAGTDARKMRQAWELPCSFGDKIATTLRPLPSQEAVSFFEHKIITKIRTKLCWK